MTALYIIAATLIAIAIPLKALAAAAQLVGGDSSAGLRILFFGIPFSIFVFVLLVLAI